MYYSVLPLFYMIEASKIPKYHTFHIQYLYLILAPLHPNSDCTNVDRRTKEVIRLWRPLGHNMRIIVLWSLKNMGIL